MDTTTPILVIARHDEDINWVDGHRHIVVQKYRDLPNIGREITSYLWFMLTYYDELEGEYIFVQGRPFDHSDPFTDKGKHLGEWLVSMPDGAPHDSGFNLHDICQQLDLPLLPQYPFVRGGMFRATAEEIRKRPRNWYVKAFALAIPGRNPWAFERLWPTIFPPDSPPPVAYYG